MMPTEPPAEYAGRPPLPDRQGRSGGGGRVGDEFRYGPYWMRAIALVYNADHACERGDACAEKWFVLAEPIDCVVGLSVN